jgi:hypothetical protein
MGIGPSPATVNEWVDLTFVNRPVWLQLHTGDPGTNGRVEHRGCGRQAVGDVHQNLHGHCAADW